MARNRVDEISGAWGKCADSRAMAAVAKGKISMTGFNYIRTPASQFARKLVAEGAIGDVTWFRGEHTEDFMADPNSPATWRTLGDANGTMGDLAPHMINAALALIGVGGIATAEQAYAGNEWLYNG